MRLIPWATVIAASLVAAACASGSGESTPPRPPEPALLRNAEAGPALAAEVPEGFTVEAVTAGNATQTWADPEAGSDEPFLVLAPAGEAPTPANATVVSLAGIPDEGGIRRLAGGGEAAEAITIADGVAYLSEGVGQDRGSDDEGPAWSELVAPVTEHIATRITAPTGSLDTGALVAIARTVEPGRSRLANPGPFTPNPEERRTDTARPGLSERPPGLEPVGGADAIAAMAALPTAARAELDSLPGSYRTTYARDRQVLTVTTLPGVALDPWAMATGLTRFQRPPPAEVELGTLDDQPAAWFDREVGGADDGSDLIGTARTLVTIAPWGDAVLVASRDPGGDPLSEDELGDIAIGVGRAGLNEWKAAVQGAGFGPDPGATELISGAADDGTRWVAQATGPPDAIEYSILTEDGERVGTTSMASGSLGPEGRDGEPDEGSPPGLASTYWFPGPFSGPRPAAAAEAPDDPFPTVTVTELVGGPPDVRVVIQRPDCTLDPVRVVSELDVVATGSALAGEPARVAVAVGPRAVGEGACPPPADSDPAADGCLTGVWALDADGTRIGCF